MDTSDPVEFGVPDLFLNFIVWFIILMLLLTISLRRQNGLWSTINDGSEGDMIQKPLEYQQYGLLPNPLLSELPPDSLSELPPNSGMSELPPNSGMSELPPNPVISELPAQPVK